MTNLVHWRSTPRGVCTRKDQGSDSESTSYPTPSGATVTVTQSGEADWPGNVTCKVCKAAIREADARWKADRLAAKRAKGQGY